MGVSNYNTDPDLNTSIPASGGGSINVAEGCPPSGINNAIRQVMADIKTADGGYVKTTGSQSISGTKTFAGSVVHSAGATFSSGATVKSGLTVSGGATVSGGIAVSSGNINVNRVSAVASVAVDNGYADSRGHNVALLANQYGNGGVYDTTNSRWIVYNGTSGNTIVPASATFQGGATISGGLTVSGGITGICTSATSATSAGKATSATSATNAASAGNATNATSLGGVAASEYITSGGAQILTGEKKFSAGIAGQGDLINPNFALAMRNGLSDTTYSGHPVKVVGTSSGSTFGYAFGDGGLAILAGGEAAKKFLDNAAPDGSSEQAYILSDQNVTVMTNLNGDYYSRHSFNFTTGGNLQIDGGSGAVVAATFSGTATNATSLGGVAASSYVRKTTNLQHGSATLLTSGTTMSAGASKDVTVSWTAFGGVPQVICSVRGGNNSYALNINASVYSVTSSGATFRCKNLSGSTFTASAASYVDWIAVYG